MTDVETIEDRRNRLREQELNSPEKEGFYYMSFADPTGFLGGVFTRAHGIITATERAHELGINPGGEVMCWGPLQGPAEEFIDRLLSKDELELITPRKETSEDEVVLQVPGNREGQLSETHWDRLKRIAGDIQLGMDCTVRLGAGRGENQFFVQIKCWRRDTITGEMGFGYGGKAWPSEYASDSEIVQMIFGLYKSYWEHEARETFIWRGRRPFGPHISTEALWEVARRVDLRSQRHEEEKSDE